jgi:hypothetical protein
MALLVLQVQVEQMVHQEQVEIVEQAVLQELDLIILVFGIVQLYTI